MATEADREKYPRHTLSTFRQIWGSDFYPPFPRTPESMDALEPITVAQGEVMSRPILDLKTRSIIIFSVMTALGMKPEGKLYIRALMKLGYSVREIAEMIVQVGLYAGIPRAIDFNMLLKEVVDEDAERGESESFFYKFPGF